MTSKIILAPLNHVRTEFRASTEMMFFQCVTKLLLRYSLSIISIQWVKHNFGSIKANKSYLLSLGCVAHKTLSMC